LVLDTTVQLRRKQTSDTKSSTTTANQDTASI
jgi:hypothetical protein